MDVLIVLVFVSLLLVGGAVLLLLVSLHQRDFEHADRLSLLPLMEPEGPGGAPRRAAEGRDRPAAGPDLSEI